MTLPVLSVDVQWLWWRKNNYWQNVLAQQSHIHDKQTLVCCQGPGLCWSLKNSRSFWPFQQHHLPFYYEQFDSLALSQQVCSLYQQRGACSKCHSPQWWWWWFPCAARVISAATASVWDPKIPVGVRPDCHFEISITMPWNETLLWRPNVWILYNSWVQPRSGSLFPCNGLFEFSRQSCRIAEGEGSACLFQYQCS